MVTVETREGVRWTTVPKFLKAHKGLVSNVTLWHWINENKIPHVRVGRKVLLPVDALDQMCVGGE